MVKNNTIMICEIVSPELADWFLNLNIFDRELILMNAYMDDKLGMIKNGQGDVE